MSVPRIYLETTVFNFLFVPNKPGYGEYRVQVEKVFDMIRAGKFVPYTSIYAVNELDLTVTQERRDRMKQVIEDYGIDFLEKTDEVERLAALYVKAGAVPAAYMTDAAHIAITAVNGLDFIVSLNFEHIVRPWTIERVGRINIQEGYKGIGIYKPGEVLEL